MSKTSRSTEKQAPPPNILDLLEAMEAMTMMKQEGGLTITVHPLTFGRGRISIGPDDLTVGEFW